MSKDRAEQTEVLCEIRDCLGDLLGLLRRALDSDREIDRRDMLAQMAASLRSIDHNTK